MTKRYANPFPPLQLKHEDATQLEGLAHAFVRSSMEQYERFAFDYNCAVDERRWKFVLQRDNVKAFAERRRKELQKSGSSFGFISDDDDFPDAPVTNNDELPVLLLCGTIDGNLGDALYAYTCPTLDVMRIKTSYIEDEMASAAVLATLVQPTPSDPFRSLTIKWFEKQRPMHVRAVVKNRDFVYMESTGVSLLSNGERVGYHLMHSVQFPQTPELDTVIRGNMSVTGIFRQRPDNKVDIYIRGVLNPAGGLMRSIIIKSAANGYISCHKYMHCAELKKLAWMLRKRRQLFKSQRAAAELKAQQENATAELALKCTFCGKRKSSFSLLHSSNPNSSSSFKRQCRICLQQVCKSCRVQKKLSFIAKDLKLVQSDLTFCSNCVSEVARLDALQVAKDELEDNESVTWSDAYAHSSSSSSAEFSPNASVVTVDTSQFDTM